VKARTSSAGARAQIVQTLAELPADGQHWQLSRLVAQIEDVLAGAKPVKAPNPGDGIDLTQCRLGSARVYIENKSYDQVIQRFCKSCTFFYIDPPYWDCEKDYGEGLFGKGYFTRLGGLLGP